MNGTEIGCTVSYCHDIHERNLYYSSFICLYSHKYAEGEDLREIGDPNCQPDLTFQCLCSGQTYVDLEYVLFMFAFVLVIR